MAFSTGCGLRTLGLVALVLASSCGNGTPVDGAAPLLGRTFLSERVTENDVERPLVTGTQIRLTVAGADDISASAGCNLIGGTLRVTDGRLRIDALGTTDMGCDPDRHRQDEWLAEFLGADPAFDLDGDRLTLRSSGTTVELLDRRVADPDRPLRDTAWRLDGIIDGDVASSVPANVVATVRIVGNRLVVTIEGCGTEETTVIVRAESLVTSNLAASSNCRGEATNVRSAMIAALGGTARYRIEAGSLTITGAEDRGITLRAVP